MTQAHSKPLSSFGIKKMRVGKILADLGEYRVFRVTRNTAGIRYLCRFRRSHSDKLIHGTLPGTLPRVITPTPLFRREVVHFALSSGIEDFPQCVELRFTGDAEEGMSSTTL